MDERDTPISMHAKDSLKAQMDTFDEKKGLPAQQDFSYAVNDSQQLLDHFCNDLQQQLDSFMQENQSHLVSAAKDDGGLAGMEADLGDVLPVKHSPPSARTTVVVKKMAASLSDSAPLDFELNNILIAVLASGAALVLVISWYFWPTSHFNRGYQHVVPQWGAGSSTEPDSIVGNALDKYGAQQAVLARRPVISEHIVEPAPLMQAKDVSVIASKTAISDVNALIDESIKLTAALAGNSTFSSIVVGQEESVAAARMLKLRVPIGRIRNAPSLDGAVVARLKMGSLVPDLGRKGAWFQIRLPDGRKAWGYKNIFSVLSVPAASSAEHQSGQAAKAK